MPRKQYEIFMDGELMCTTEGRQKAEVVGRFLLERCPKSSIAIREWIPGIDEVLQ